MLRGDKSAANHHHGDTESTENPVGREFRTLHTFDFDCLAKSLSFIGKFICPTLAPLRSLLVGLSL